MQLLVFREAEPQFNLRSLATCIILSMSLYPLSLGVLLIGNRNEWMIPIILSRLLW